LLPDLPNSEQEDERIATQQAFNRSGEAGTIKMIPIDIGKKLK
jgi:hypothetical protein